MAPRRASVSYLTDTLPSAIAPIFDQAQNTTANHRKNIVQLRKIHETCADVTEETPKGIRLVGERAFNNAFVGMVNRVLPVKKGVAVADRIVKFVASYVAYTTENAKEEDDGDSMASRFITKLLKHLIAGMDAKDKNVRFRVTLMATSLINGLGEIDDDLYLALRQGLLERSNDKESAVRVQAALGLAKLAPADGDEDLEEGEESISDVLLDLLRYDPAAEVRRAVLYNLPVNPQTMPLVLARSRDLDPILRRTVFQGSLNPSIVPARTLTIAQRVQLVQNGLTDRDPSVRKAAASMLGGWLDQDEGDLLVLLQRLDVVSSSVAADALKSIFVTRPDVFEAIGFDEAWWESLTPEKAFLTRVFAEHCVAVKNEVRLEETLPVVTNLAFRIQDVYNQLTEAERDSDKAQELAFTVSELLRLALNLDYADEIGRRKMFNLSRQMIAQMELPEDLIPPSLDVLAKISMGERDLIRLIVDVVTELRLGDGDGDIEAPEPTPSQASSSGSPGRSVRERVDPEDPEAAALAANIDLRCLFICISLLERVNTPLQENSVFLGLLPDLIIPAVKNSDVPELRAQGLVSLGLCSMIDGSIAHDSFGLFVQQLAVADEDLKVKITQMLFDMLMVHDINTLLAPMPPERIIELIRHLLNQDADAVQAAACEGVAKLMLAGMISDSSVLQSLILLYFSPETADNQPLRQCLTYFLPVYCYSSPINQRILLDIFTDTFAMLSELPDEYEGSNDLLPLGQMGLMMVDWLDPQKTVGTAVDHGVHLDLALELLKALLTETSRDVRKTIATFFSKLNLPDSAEVDAWKTKALYQLLSSIKEKRPLSDATSRNAISRFEVALGKRYPELEGYDEETFRAEGETDEATRELFGFIDDVEESQESPSRRGSRATSRARSMASAEPDSDATPVKPRRPKIEPVAEESEEEEDDDEIEGMLGSD